MTAMMTMTAVVMTTATAVPTTTPTKLLPDPTVAHINKNAAYSKLIF